VNYRGAWSGRGNEMLNGSIVVTIPAGTAIMAR